jgi:hypothetical protein
MKHDPSSLARITAAAALQVSRPALSSLLNGKADLRGHGAPDRESFWSEDGNAYADASLL